MWPEAFAWYEAQAEGLGPEFRRAFFATVARASRHLEMSRIVYADLRRIRLRRFPYSLYYRAETAETVFFLLFHAARNPDQLRRTLQTRRSAL